MKFLESLNVRTPAGKVPWGSVMPPEQRQFLQAISPSLLAVERGQPPAYSVHWLEATKGWGKTMLGAACVTRVLAFSPEPLPAEIGAKDRDQAGEALDSIEDMLRLNPYLKERLTLQAWGVVNKYTGARCDVLSSDARGAHGSRPWLVWVDELVHHTDEHFASTCLDNAAKIACNLTIFTTNAGFLDTWPHRWREQYRIDPHCCFQAITTPPPWKSQRAIEQSAKRNTASRELRLNHGVWVADVGEEAIHDADLQAAITQSGPMTNPEWERHSFLGGLDLSVRRDHSAYVVWASDHERHRVRLAHAREWCPVAGQDIDLRDVRREILEVRDRLGCRIVLCDEYQATLLAQLLREDDVWLYPVPQAGKAAAARAMALVDAFKARMVDLYDYHPLIRDLKKLRVIERNSSVRLEAAADSSGHADTAFAGSFALHDAVENCHKTLVFESDLEIERAYV